MSSEYRVAGEAFVDRQALARNGEFAAAGGHQGAVVLPTLRLFVIGCLDPRVDQGTCSASS